MRESEHPPFEQQPHQYYHLQQQQPQQQHGGGSAAPSKAEYFIAQLNVTNAKKVAALMVIGFICYHGLIHLHYGADKLTTIAPGIGLITCVRYCRNRLVQVAAVRRSI